MTFCIELERFTGETHLKGFPGIGEQDPAELRVNHSRGQDPAAFLFGVIPASPFVVGNGW